MKKRFASVIFGLTMIIIFMSNIYASLDNSSDKKEYKLIPSQDIFSTSSEYLMDWPICDQIIYYHVDGGDGCWYDHVFTFYERICYPGGNSECTDLPCGSDYDEDWFLLYCVAK